MEKTNERKREMSLTPLVKTGNVSDLSDPFGPPLVLWLQYRNQEL